MGRKTIKTTERSIKQKIKEGYGRGAGPNYLPWHLVQHFSSRGLALRVWGGHLTGRIHHFFSQGEYLWFCYFRSLQDVVDIQEQFPLFPRELTIALAELLGIKHPTDPDTGLETTMTTDLFVTFLRGGREYVAAYSVKMSKDLDHPRTLDKLSLEMLYWREVGRPFQLLTERELPYERARNFHMLQHHLVDLDRRVNVSKERLHDIAEEMTRQVISTDLALRHVTTDCDNRFALPPGSCLSVAFHLVANGYWDVDLSKRLYPVDRVVLLSTPPSAILHLLGVAA